MENNHFLTELIVWLQEWRGKHNIPQGGILSGEILEQFVAELQTEITKRVGNFGNNTVGENADLALYSGTNYGTVGDYCAERCGSVRTSVMG